MNENRKYCEKIYLKKINESQGFYQKKHIKI